jgi:hypothetical protein
MPFVKGFLSASKTICVYLETLLLGSNGIDMHCVEGILVPSVVFNAA